MNYNLLSQVPVTPDQVQKALTTQDYTTIGVLVVAVSVLVLGFWKLSSWTGKEVIIPVRDKAFKMADEGSTKLYNHLDKVGTSMDILGKSMDTIAENLGKLAEVPERLDRIEKKVDTVTSKVENMDVHMKLQDAKLDNLSKGH